MYPLDFQNKNLTGDLYFIKKYNTSFYTAIYSESLDDMRLTS